MIEFSILTYPAVGLAIAISIFLLKKLMKASVWLRESEIYDSLISNTLLRKCIVL